MEDYKYLRELESIDSTNRFINYITDRVISDDYRGIQCSQQNRLTYKYFCDVIETIYDIANDNRFDIHVGDDRGVLQAQAKLYYDVVEGIRQKSGKGTVNSVKKNTFPDIARMGFLERFDKKGIKISEGISRKPVYSVKLSDIGMEFVQSNTFKRIKLFTDGVDKITHNTASELVEILYLNNLGVEYIDILEYMYILSDERSIITTNDKLDILLSYRSLSRVDRDRVDRCLRAFCDPQNRKSLDNKTLLRDYSNWKNESQQIYGLLANSTYFKVENNKLILNTGNYGIFDTNTKRGTKSKTDYLRNHKIGQFQKGYELHHIIPFSRAENKSDAISIDNFKNLIYLKDKKHDEFTYGSNDHVIMEYVAGKPDILFMDFDGSWIAVDIKEDALILTEMLPEMKKYNNYLINRFYHTKI